MKTTPCALLGLAGLLASAAVRAAPAEPPSPATESAQTQAEAALPTSDARDLDFASRGFLGTRQDPVIRTAQGRAVWDLSAFDFLKGARPASVNPSLWRQARLMAMHGLFRVGDRIWQVRGFDLANITFVRGDSGWVVIDALGSIETARAALDLANEKLGARPVSAVVYTHSHVDHYGGAGGLVDAASAKSGKVRVIAPKGFLAAAIGENLVAGPAMQRRAAYQFGVPLAKGASGLVGAGIGPGLASGTGSLVAPTEEIERSGEALVDGVRLAFQLTPGTEAPAEMNVAFPDWRVVDLAENANATQHNILTPRGAVVRDARAWAGFLTEALDAFGDSDVLITSHGWPRFGNAVVTDYLAKHRDAYAFLHDQTVRLMNRGLTGDEIADRLKLPPALEQEWFNRPYYGSLSFNSRAVYQFYMGWYDANPAHLAPLPPAQAGRRYVAAMGGPAKVLELARQSYDRGDYAWAAELLNRAVMADASDRAARQLLARCYEQLAWQSENSLWRNIYLTGAGELRDGVAAAPARPPAAEAAALAGLPTAALLDLLAVRLDADKAGAASLKLRLVFAERGEQVDVVVRNGVLTHRPAAKGAADATFALGRDDFVAAVFAGVAPAPGRVKADGDAQALARLAGWIERPARDFPIVTR